MKWMLCLVPAVALALITPAEAAQTQLTTPATQPAGPLKTEAARLSYALGMDMGNWLKELDTEIDGEAVVRAIHDALEGREPLMTPEQAEAVKTAFIQRRQADMARQREEAAEKNLEQGQAFLAENKKKEGVVTTASGLQYKVLRAGTGEQPEQDDVVKFHYRGQLLDGTVFDSSYDRDQPLVYPVGRLIPGWTEGLQLMKVGGKYRLFIPPELGYGAQGQGQVVGPNATLIFEVELLGIEEQEQPAPELPEDDEPLPEEMEADEDDMDEDMDDEDMDDEDEEND